jgi:mono/diheme cytochrome c family protein
MQFESQSNPWRDVMTKWVMAGAVALAAIVATDAGAAMHPRSEANMLERGKYLVKLGGCNDCHTSGYIMTNGEVPESQWLMGDTLGWKGPWGTTYATNLRIKLGDMSEQDWLSFAKTMKARPPMPWFTVNQMSDKDLRAIYRFIRHLGPGGKPAPSYLPPDKDTPPPYVLFPSPPAAQ